MEGRGVVGRSGGEKMETTVFEQQEKKKKKKTATLESLNYFPLYNKKVTIVRII